MTNKKQHQLEKVSGVIKKLYYSYRAMVQAITYANLKSLNVQITNMKKHLTELKDLGYNVQVNFPDRELTVEDIESLSEHQRCFIKQGIEVLFKAVIECERVAATARAQLH